MPTSCLLFWARGCRSNLAPESLFLLADSCRKFAEMKRCRNGETWDFENEIRTGEDVILGIDGGTTTTVCVCVSLSHLHALSLSDRLPVLARVVAGCSNHNSIGETGARETLEQVMAEALSKSGSNRSAVRAVCLAVSGVDHPTDQQRILSWLRDIFPSHVNLYVQNDAVAALASGTMGKLHGCVLIAGTGTIAYGFTEDGREARAAGAGPVLGDWGSGYGIAAQALTAIIRAHDGRGPRTKLRNGILQELGLSSPDELIGWTYADPSWARIAALVPVVVSCAEAGDDVANSILLDSVEELASSVKAVVQRLGLSGEDGVECFPLVMVGGVLEANKRWDISKEVIASISKEYPGVVAIRPKLKWCTPSCYDSSVKGYDRWMVLNGKRPSEMPLSEAFDGSLIGFSSKLSRTTTGGARNGSSIAGLEFHYEGLSSARIW